MQPRHLSQVLAVVFFAALMSACGGSPSSDSVAPTETVQGVSTPGSVSMVSATNAD